MEDFGKKQYDSYVRFNFDEEDEPLSGMKILYVTKETLINWKANRTHLFLALSFLTPFFIQWAVFLVCSGYFFPGSRLFISDMEYQYHPFLNDYWYRLREGNSLLWSWTAGGGIDYFSLYSYYLTSPLNFLLALLPHSWMDNGIVFLILCKIGFAGLFMGMYLRYAYNKCDFIMPVFATFYALCSFTICYYWTIIWLDTFALMPLVMLGFFAFMREGKFRLYIISLALSIFTNYYMSYYTCVFVILTFPGQCFLLRLNMREILRKLVLITVYSCVAIGLCSFILFPSYSAVKDNAAMSFPDTIQIYNSFYYILGNFLSFTWQTSNLNIPALYCGMLSIMLIGVFLGSARISYREKVVFVLTTAFLIISCNLNILYYIMNAFHFPRGVFQRYTFLISFIIVAHAYRAYTETDKMESRDLLSMGIFTGIALWIAWDGIHAPYVMKNFILCAIYLLIFAFLGFFSTKQTILKTIICLALLAVAVAETGITSHETARRYIAGRGESSDKYNNVRQLLNTREESNGFYRTELTGSFNKSEKTNDPSLYNYNGISFYSSTANKNVTMFMSGLGLIGTDISQGYVETSPLTNSFLNLRYLVSHDGNPSDGSVFWKVSEEAPGLLLLENRYYLPFGFMVNKETAGYAPDIDNPFISQNELFGLATGLKGDLFTLIQPADENHVNYAVSRDESGKYIFSLDREHDDGSLNFEYKMPADGMLYAYINNTAVNNIANVAVSSRQISIKRPYIFPVGYFQEGETVLLRLDIITNSNHVGLGTSITKSGSMAFYAGFLNMDLFEEGFALLSDETLALTKFTDTVVEGYVTVKEEGLLYVSIPFENHWRAYVDGVKTDIVPIGESMAGLSLTEGEHKIEFRYYNNNLLAGVCVSLIALCAFAGLIVFETKSKDRDGGV